MSVIFGDHAVVSAKRLTGWRRFVPVLYAPVWLVGMAFGTLLLPETAGITIGQGAGAIMWVLLGLAVRDANESRIEARSEPAVGG